MKTELERLYERIEEIKKIQQNCNHEWEEPIYDPEKKEIMDIEHIYLGSDSFDKEVGTGEYKDIPRWSRTCSKCEKKEYTYEQEKIIVESKNAPKI